MRKLIIYSIIALSSLALRANDIKAFGISPTAQTNDSHAQSSTTEPSLVVTDIAEIIKSLPKANIADKSVPRIDASSEQKLQQSFSDVLLSIEDETKQQTFASAMATIGVIYANAPSVTLSLMELLNGRSADEIIMISRKLSPQIRQNSNIIDGSTPEKFGKSIASIIISLPVEHQGKFTEAIAKLMYEAKQAGKPETSIAKELDGKTAQEVIDLASRIKLPFEINSNSPVIVDSPTKSELEEYVPQKKATKDSSYTPSLVPSANLK